MRRNLLLCLLFAGVTLALYWPVRNFESISLDDPEVWTTVDALHHGWTWAGVKWALTSVVVGNWHPVTNLSFLALSQFYGAAPGPQHLANAVIHAANAMLVFLLLQRLTGATWRSAMAAAIFAWHPLRVESVAWVSERKDVLCAFFFFLSLLGYAVHVQNRKAEKRWGRDYALCLTAFALALLSKPMAVTLPFVLLLLDFWPFGRLAVEGQTTQRTAGEFPVGRTLPILMRLAVQKWPFFVLTVLFCVLTYCVQKVSSAVIPWNALSFWDRISNMVVGYAAYAGKLFWPTNLAVIYQLYPWHDYGEVTLKGALLIAITLGCIMEWYKRPWLAMGWFWYLGTALPVIGFVQVGEQSMADRYTYIPLIGLTVAIVWAAAEALSKFPGHRVIATVTAITLSCVLCFFSEQQLQYWRNDIELFGHAAAVTGINPEATYFWGLGFEHAGQTNQAITAYRMTLRITPYEPYSRSSLAAIYIQQGRLKDAETIFREYLARRPDEFQANLSLAGLLAQEGRERDYIEQLQRTVVIRNDVPDVLNNLAWELSTSPDTTLRDGPQAVQLAQRACELTHYQVTVYIGTLAAAYAQAGDFDAAITTAQRAIATAEKNNDQVLLASNQRLLERYQQHLTAQ